MSTIREFRGSKPQITTNSNGEVAISPLAGARIVASYMPHLMEDTAKKEFFQSYREVVTAKGSDYKYTAYAGEARNGALKAAFDVGKRIGLFADGDVDLFMKSHTAQHEKLPKEKESLKEFCYALVDDLQRVLIPMDKVEIDKASLGNVTKKGVEKASDFDEVVALAQKVHDLEVQLAVKTPLDVNTIKQFYGYSLILERLKKRHEAVLEAMEINDILSSKPIRSQKVKAYLSTSWYACGTELDEFEYHAPYEESEGEEHDDGMEEEETQSARDARQWPGRS